MKTVRNLSLGVSALLLAALSSAPVLAQTYPPPVTPPPPGPGAGAGAGAAGAGPGAEGGIVFTGADLTVALVLVVALIGLGLVTLTVGRRRALQ